ncbi:MAG TPA: hypothetical protein VLI92_03735 [Candidatus Saccharimonadales bacterium]|nr:hypothetical protein [Candidatus Saccharimonadales bacterium]
MKLVGNAKMVFGNNTIDESTLESDRQRWRGKALIPGVSPEKNSDLATLHACLYELVPVTIFAADGKPLILRGEFVRFKYTVRYMAEGKVVKRSDGELYGLRLSPEQGIVRDAVLDKNSTLAVEHLRRNPVLLSACFGIGVLQCEIFYKRLARGKVHPPLNYRRYITLPVEDSIYVD